VGDIDFEVISATENSNKFQKPRFWKEKSIEDLGPTAEVTLVIHISCVQMNPNNETTGSGTSLLGFCETFGLVFGTFGLEL
jgi:hypothetical protein